MKDVVVRALKTFIQAAISYVCTISFIDIDWSDNTVVGGVILAALAAGISALMNIDWDAISLEKAVEKVDDADYEDAEVTDYDSETDADVVTDEEDTTDVDSEDEDIADDTNVDESAEDETEKACG